MIPASEAQPLRNLWAAVAMAALLDHHKRIHRAKRSGSTTRIAYEVTAARSYVESADFREVCGNAGIWGFSPDTIMAQLEAGTMQFNLTAGRDFERQHERTAS